MLIASATSFETFDEVNLQTAQELVAAASDESEQVNWKFFNDDHWQDATMWTGPHVQDAGGGQVSTDLKNEIARAFISNNVTREIVVRLADGVLSREPSWGAAVTGALDDGEEPNESESAAIGEMDALMLPWARTAIRGTYTDAKGRLKTCDVHSLLARAAKMFAATGRANLRVFIPPGKRIKQTVGEREVWTLPPLPLADSLERVFVELCEPGVACLHTDRRRMEQIGIYLWTERNRNFAEVTYVVKEQTVLRTLVSSSASSDVLDLSEARAKVPDGEEPAAAFDLSGHLMHFEMSDDALVMPSILSQQKGINKTLTMGDRNMNLAGFPERVLTEAQLNGKTVDDPTAINGKRFVADPPNVGAGTINNFVGIEYLDPETGQKRRTTPTYNRLDPIGSETFDAAADAARRRMLDAARQTHALISGDATASGVSRAQARHEFEKSLSDTIKAVNAAGRWLFDTALALAIATSNEPKKQFAGVAFNFACLIDVGPVDAGERTEDRAQVQAGLLSRETAMVRGGIDDPDTERARIASEEEGSLTMQEQRATILEIMARAGAGIESAAQVAGFSEEDAALLGQGDFVDPNDPNPNNPDNEGGGGGTGG